MSEKNIIPGKLVDMGKLTSYDNLNYYQYQPEGNSNLRVRFFPLEHKPNIFLADYSRNSGMSFESWPGAFQEFTHLERHARHICKILNGE
jgi:hypothetical protein